MYPLSLPSSPVSVYQHAVGYSHYVGLIAVVSNEC